MQRELFARLREQAAPELRPVIDYWEPNYLADDCIARGEFDRRLVHRVRLLARAILAELAREIQPRAHRNGNADVKSAIQELSEKRSKFFPGQFTRPPAYIGWRVVRCDQRVGNETPTLRSACWHLQ